MGYIEGCDGELTHLHGLFLLYHTHVLGRELAAHTIIAIDSLVHQLRGIHGLVKVIGHIADCLYVVCMVVCHEHRIYLLQAHTHAFQMLFHGSGADACVDEQAGAACLQVVAIPAAPRTQCHKLDH